MRKNSLLLVRTLTGLLIAAAAACSSSGAKPVAPPTPAASTPAPSLTSPPARVSAGLPGMPPVLDPHDIYAADRPNRLSPVVRNDPALVYVPNSGSNTVDVIDQRTFQIVGHYPVGRLPQHVTPSWDLKTLYATNDLGNSLTAFDPRTGKPTQTLPVDDPYNMYFTPDGRYSIVVAERLRRLDFRDAHTMRLVKSVSVQCRGVDHADFSADGRFAVFSCEFSGQLVKIDIARKSVISYLTLSSSAMPQDVKTSPDGKIFYVADMASNGVWLVDGNRMRVLTFLPTGKNAHGLYVSRDSRYLYVSNRGEGSISLIDLRKKRVATKWHLPGGGSPDMGGVSADGRILWLSGRYNGVVYAISTVDGRLIKEISVGSGPHGLCVYPQPGRYSLGHTGVFR
jgi:DNA-binding beta-propeller fold protein YncE